MHHFRGGRSLKDWCELLNSASADFCGEEGSVLCACDVVSAAQFAGTQSGGRELSDEISVVIDDGDVGLVGEC